MSDIVPGLIRDHEWHALEMATVPGVLDTSLDSGIDVPSGESEASERAVVAPDEAGRHIVDAIESDRRRILIGSDAATMWWVNRISPDLASNLMYQGMKDLLQ